MSCCRRHFQKPFQETEQLSSRALNLHLIAQIYRLLFGNFEAKAFFVKQDGAFQIFQVQRCQVVMIEMEPQKCFHNFTEQDWLHRAPIWLIGE